MLSSTGTNDAVSRHARVRMQQRGIPMQVVDFVLNHGKGERRGRVMSYQLDRWGHAEAREYFGERLYRRYEKALGCYVIASDDDCLITVAHAY